MPQEVVLIHHGANRGRLYPQGSLRALQHCLSEGARIVEVDIIPLLDGEFALLHDDDLARSTTGTGRASECTSSMLAGLRLLWRGAPSSEPVLLLSQALELLAEFPDTQELQLDLKVQTAAPLPLLTHLVSRLSPLRDRVRVTSGADWALGRLRALDAALPLGFDPGWYLDASPHPYDPPEPPIRRGVYGYYDDHPLALERGGTAREYLEARAEGLVRQAPPRAGIWYLHGRLVERSLADGFDWIAWLHERGILVDVWTLDADQRGHVEAAQALASLGVDRITTNDPPALAARMGPQAVY